MNWSNISAQTVFLAVGFVLLLLTGYNTFASARKNHRDEQRLQDQPIVSLQTKVDQIENRLVETEKDVERLKGRLTGHDGQMRLLLRSQLALLRHGIDGNNISDLRDCQQAIQDFLVERN